MARIPHVLLVFAALFAAYVAYADEIRLDFDYSANMPIAMAKAQVNEFQAAVASRSCFQVAALTRFPFPMNRGGKTKWIDNRTAFCRYFPILFDEVRSEIIASQEFKRMSAGWRGLMFGKGEFWLTPACANDSHKLGCPESQQRLWLNGAHLFD